MDLGLTGTVALVTASSDGLGKAIAYSLAREGARVAICARSADVLEATAVEISEATGADIIAVVCDLSKRQEVDHLVKTTGDRFGRLDILVNNAGGPPPGAFGTHEDEAWQHTFELNLMSCVRLTRAALPFLRDSGRGRIINMTSTAVRQPIDGLVLANSLRAAVVGLAKTLSVELAPFGITVNNIAPGRIDTERVRSLDRTRAVSLGITEEEARERQIAQIPLGRYGTADEVANLALFLASDKASYITGTTIQVDGGLVRGLP